MIKEIHVPSFSKHRFLLLLVSIMKTQRYGIIIKKNELEKDLYSFYDKPEFNFLFEDIDLKQGIDTNLVVLNEAFNVASIYGLLTRIDDSSNDLKYVINITVEEANEIISECKSEEVSAMAKVLDKIRCRKILETPYKKLVVTDKTIEDIKKHPQFYVGAPFRIATGKIYTTEEFNKRSDRVLSEKLPGEEKTSVLKRIMKHDKK